MSSDNTVTITRITVTKITADNVEVDVAFFDRGEHRTLHVGDHVDIRVPADVAQQLIRFEQLPRNPPGRSKDSS
jgi:hypothetical protein